MNQADKEAALVELQAACGACNMLAISLAMLSLCPIGSPSFKHYSGAVGHYHSEIVSHMNEFWFLTGEADPKDPVVQAMLKINREADEIRGVKR